MHFESHDTLIEGRRLHPEANGECEAMTGRPYRRWLLFLNGLEQVANADMDFGDVFRLGSKLNEWFLSLDLRQFRAAFFTQTVAPCRVELSDDEGDDDLEGENENYTCTLLDEDEWECGQRWPTARALAAHQRHTQGGTHGEPKGVASLVVTNQCFWCGSTDAGMVRLHPSTWQQQKNTTDAWLMLARFHYPVIDIPPDTICPRCDLIFNDTAELQRHLASMEYLPPDGHSLVINAETSVGACGSDLWQKIRDRWRARRAERETKTHQIATWRDEGRRGDGEHELGAEGICQGRQQEYGREATQRRPQDALRAISSM